MSPLTQADHQELQQRSLSTSQVEEQLHLLRQGTPPLQLVRPCRVGDGIIQLTPQQSGDCHTQFQIAQAAGRVSKFIPASGAATRMFKDLLQYVDNASSPQATETEPLSLPESITQGWKDLHHLPFIDDLRRYFVTEGKDLQDLYQTKQMATVFQALLHEPGLGYAHLPKALLAFHHDSDTTRTALEEHVHEAIRYADKRSDLIRVHLTVSGQFEAPVKLHIEAIQQKMAQSGINLEVSVSIQKTSTDTIALDAQGQPFRNNEGRLVFRPGGHGALLENLNDFQGDIVFISNIDNVVPDHLKGLIVEWRKTLGGYVLDVQNRIVHHLKQLELAQPIFVDEAQVFVRDHLHHQFPESYDRLSISEKAGQLTQFLDRPLRICGVVPNTGDPGGGPFWVQQADGSQSRQIVEQSQADPKSLSQQQLFSSATHFNPVDMVCGVRDYQGHPFNLLNFRDPQTSFISHKTFQGRPLKALEWPGLWNGGMANWITLFVEVPRSTFNPVKTFLDWLQPNHQPPT